MYIFMYIYMYIYILNIYVIYPKQPSQASHPSRPPSIYLKQPSLSPPYFFLFFFLSRPLYI